MSHNLEIVNGIASYVENGRKERAWHGLGQVFDGPMTVKEALELSHADYKVELHSVAAITPEILEAVANGTVTTDMLLDTFVPNRKVTMRTDTMKPLGVVSDQYGIVQNEDAFKFIDTLVTGTFSDKEHTPVIETAGVLGNGERVFVTARFPERIQLDNAGNDMVDMNIVFTTSHDGSGAVQCLVTPVRVVCNNTLNYAMRNNKGKISLRHTSGINSRLDFASKENAEFAYKTLGIYDIYKKSFEESLRHLRNIRVSEKQLNDILADVILSDANLEIYRKTGNIYHEDITTRGRNQFTDLREAVESGVGQEYGEKGTGLWLINGVTTYYQNNAYYQNEDKKFDSITDGFAKNKLQKAYDLVTAI